MTDTGLATYDKGNFLADIDARDALSVPEWLRTVREHGAERFRRLDYPNRKQEAWRFTNIAPILRTPFRTVSDAVPSVSADDLRPHLYGLSDWTELVFVNGAYAPNLSTVPRLPKGVSAGSLAQAWASNGVTVRDTLDRCFADDANVFAALNTALLSDGALVHVPRGVRLESPVHLVFVTSGAAEASAAHPRALVILEPGAEAQLVESHVAIATDAPHLSNAVVEAVLGDGASLTRCKILNEGQDGYHLSATRVHQGRDSRFQSFSIFLGARIARNELEVVLDGEGAECSLKGLSLAESEQLIDNATGIEHAKPHCSSWIGYKSVLDGASHGVFTGRIHVHRDAQKTDSKQLNNTLLLSDRATINTKPQLEIFADDVKCTHGATVGPPPPELIFYFRSRGISERTARALLTCGFAGEVVDEIPVGAVRERLHDIIYRRFNRQEG